MDVFEPDLGHSAPSHSLAVFSCTVFPSPTTTTIFPSRSISALAIGSSAFWNALIARSKSVCLKVCGLLDINVPIN